MKTCKLVIHDEVNVSFVNVEPRVRNLCNAALKHFLPHARHTPAFKLGRWDGTVSLFAVNGNTYLNLLDRVLPIIVDNGYEVEIEDNRIQRHFEFPEIDEEYCTNFMPNSVWPKGHPAEGQKIMLRDYQVEIIKTFIENPQSMQEIATGAGKEQPLSAKILTPSGWTTMGEIKLGDKVVDPDGGTANVVGVHPQGVKQVYEFTFSDGRQAQAGIDHLWRVCSYDWPDDGDLWRIMSTNELMDHINMRRVFVQHAAPVETEYLHTYSDFTEEASKLKMDEGIPEQYMRMGIDQRLALISAIIERFSTGRDFDSNVNVFGKLAEDFAYMVRELGGQATISNGFVDVLVVNGPTSKTGLKLGIERIAPSHLEECQCISLDSENHLYITDNFVVTHNTLLTATLSHVVEAYGRSLIIVPNKSLVEQTEADYRNLGLDVGVYYGDRKDIGKTHTICTWQSLDRIAKGTAGKTKTNVVDFADFIDGVVCVIVDECHQAKADVLKNMMTGAFANIPIRWGLTGTIPKEPHAADTMFSSLGPVVNRLAAKDLMDKGVLSTCDVEILQLMDTMDFKTYHEEYEFLTTDRYKLEWLSGLVQKTRLTGNTLVLVNRVATGKELQDMIPDSEFISGNVKSADRNETYADASENDNMAIIATYGVAAVGINIPRIFNLILIEPGKSFVRVIQSIGRGIRKAKDKDYVRIYDVASTCKFSNAHLNKRKKFYDDANYPHTTTKVDYLRGEMLFDSTRTE